MKHTYCIFSANYFPTLGGVERYTYNLSKYLIEKGNQVIIVTSNVHHLAHYEEIEGIKIYRLPCINLLGGRFPVTQLNLAMFKMLKQVKKENIDYTIINTRFYLHSLVGMIFSKMNGKKAIVIEHGTNHFTINHPIWDKLGECYEHMITGLLRLMKPEFYGVSEACNRWLGHFNIKAKGVCFNAIDMCDIEKIMQEDTGYSFKEAYGLKENDIVITYTGRLVKEKGIEKLIQAFEKVATTHRECYLAIAGDGDLYDQIKSHVHPQIKVLGRLDFKQIISLLKETTIFCLPTDYPEGFPTSVLEAAACECYIITTTKGGSKELILSSEYGVILEENTIEEIEEAIQVAIDNMEKTNQAVQKSYTRLKEHFTWEQTSQKIIEIFKN
ncbi:MAG: glycosyltransferase family 4 protein [Cellulosilyticum sp.]|nr:glycosyltransferase family 4 protein [Cellulosilyticum sp.]